MGAAVLARLKGFQRLTRVDQALRIVFDTVKISPPKVVTVALGECLGRVLGEDVVAREDLPRVDRSAMDGFAVRAEDTVGASQSKSKTLKLTERRLVREGEAARVWTGQLVPKGADAVERLEDAVTKGDVVRVFQGVVPHENVSRRGEDVAKDSVALIKGVRLRPYHVGLLAALGYEKVKVFRKPTVAVLATGSEIVEVGSRRGVAQVFDVNRQLLIGLCRELGLETVDLGIVGDDVDRIAAKIKEGLACADAVMSSGGTSVGRLDLVPEAVKKLVDGRLVVHGVSMRPGMPTGVGSVGDKFVLLLSGNPVASVVGFEVFGRPLFSRMLGLEETEERPVLKAKLSKRVTVALGKVNYVRVRVVLRDKEFVALPISSRGSGLVSTLTKSNGFVVVGEDREGLSEGEVVSVYLFDDVRKE